ncbi:metallopeptidase family protein [Brachybacterium sp. EF45031]|uniref:metallopeptidase family protein n=1 Tax=Brachybacterium sillae TaxID=2810536 RepID=UPI00217CC9F5|nr:metallopeptidase family protein [Brachybacterium sillae]MCS6711022.1 metallopeptidase family protein [Brachybacterium sillae]
MDSRDLTPPGPSLRRRRDRHGRGLRGHLIPPPLPGYRTRREIFDEAVLDATAPLLERFGRRLEHLQVAVEDVPPSDPAPWEPASVPLARLFPADREHPPRIVLFRRPIETRSTSPAELEILVRQVLAEQVGSLLAMDPEQVDPGAWEY